MRSIFSYDYPAIARNALVHASNVIRHYRRFYFPHWGLVTTLTVLFFVPLVISFLILLALNRIVSPEVWDRDFKDFLG